MPPKNQTSVAAALSLPRQSLRETLEALQRARALEEKAEKVAAAAKVAVEDARAESAGFGALDDDSVKARLSALKGESGAKSLNEIREARRKRAIAIEELAAAEQTQRVAEKELADARANVARLQKVCSSHATSILAERATEVIALWPK